MPSIANARLSTLFGTPVLDHVWAEAPEVNPELYARILAHAAAHPGDTRSNYGGWHSDVGALEFCGPAGARLLGYLQDVVGEVTRRTYEGFGRAAPSMNWKISAWANINRRGDYNDLHTHPGATWSAVYFVDDGESDPAAPGTQLLIYDPNPARTVAFLPELPASNVMFRPTAGLMVVFPSYLPHCVEPHRGDRARVSIAFNVRREPFP